MFPKTAFHMSPGYILAIRKAKNIHLKKKFRRFCSSICQCVQCCGSSPFFFGSESADRVLKIRILLRYVNIKDKKLFSQNCIIDNFIYRENLNYSSLFVERESTSGSEFSKSGSGSATPSFNVLRNEN